MGAKLDLQNKRFGRWIVIRESTKRKGGKVYWLCKCDCGNIGKVIGTNLKLGLSQSCGCLLRERASKANRIHGQRTTKNTTRTYQAWKAMRQRCNNSKTSAYKNYGGRGINICSHWDKFENFFEDMGEAPKGLTLDRINNDGNYEPQNCRWTTYLQQAQNNRRAKLNIFKVKLIKKLLQESLFTQQKIADIFKISRSTICSIKTGKTWSNIVYIP